MFACRFVIALVVLLLVATVSTAQQIENVAAVTFEQPPLDFPLLKAAQQNDVSAIRAMLHQGFDANTHDEKFLTAAHFAAHFQHIDALSELIRGGANLNSQDNGGWTPLHTSAFVGDINAVKLMLDANADPLLRTNDGTYAVHHALTHGHTEVARLLLQAGMVRAIATSDYFHMLMMIDNGANVNAQTESGATALIVAAHAGEAGIVAKLLATEGIRPDFQERDGWTALMFAASGNNVPILQQLMDFGIDLSVRTVLGETALDLARKFGHREAVAELEARLRHIAAYIANQQAAAQAQQAQQAQQAAQVNPVPVPPVPPVVVKAPEKVTFVASPVKVEPVSVKKEPEPIKKVEAKKSKWAW